MRCPPGVCFLSVFTQTHLRNTKWVCRSEVTRASVPDNLMCVLVEGYHSTLVACLLGALFFQSSPSDVNNASRCGSSWDRAALQTSPCLHVSIIISHDWLPVAPCRSKVRSCLCPHDEDRMGGWGGSEHVRSCVCLRLSL